MKTVRDIIEWLYQHPLDAIVINEIIISRANIDLNENIISSSNKMGKVVRRGWILIDDVNDLPTRAVNILKRAGYKYLNDVANAGYWAISFNEGMGFKTINEISKSLYGSGLWWSDIDKYDPFEKKEPCVIKEKTNVRKMKCIVSGREPEFIKGNIYHVSKWDSTGLPVLITENGLKYRSSLYDFQPIINKTIPKYE